jgi:phosphate transport system substrate-binding protein
MKYNQLLFNMIKKFLSTLAVAALAVTTVSCGGGNKSTSTSGSMTMLCDDSFQNILEEEISVFEYIYQKSHILSRYVSQKECLDSLFEGDVKTIVIGRDLTANEMNGLKKKHHSLRSMKIAVDAVALIVNPENTVDYLSMNEIGSILSGEIENWADVTPGAPNVPIEVVFDREGSGLASYMRDSLLDGRSFGRHVYATGSVEGVLERVKAKKGAIGVIGVSWLTKDLTMGGRSAEEIVSDLKADSLAVSGVEINDRMDKSGVKVLGVMRYKAVPYKPYQQNIYDGSYPLTRPIYMVTYASPSSLAGSFYTYVTGVDGQKLIMKTGILPARMQINVVELVDQ